jgi:universal stress protein F
MFKNVCVPVDLADRHERVLSAALRLLEPGGSVTLLHVIELIPGLDEAEERGFYDRLEASARGSMTTLGERLEGEGIAWQSEVVYGNRAREIVRYVVDANSDLVVLASHPLEADHPMPSTLSYQVGVLAPCPVLLVK